MYTFFIYPHICSIEQQQLQSTLRGNTKKAGLIVIVFLDEACKIKNAHLIGTILVNVGSSDLYEKFGEVGGYNFVAEHVLLKSKIKKLLRKNQQKNIKNRVK